MSENNIENILKLFSVPSIGSYKSRQLISIFGSAEHALSANYHKLKSVPGIGNKIARNLKENVDNSFVDRQLKAVASGQQEIVSFWDSRYPESLKNIYDPPVLLFYKGDLSILNRKTLAVVGTREITDYGKQVIDNLIRPLRGWDITVISGMARGIDSYTHQVCLHLQIPTAGVLAHGLDKIYPPENVAFWKKMTEENLIMTEFPLGTVMDPRHFPRRNRIITGVSQGTLVVQAAEKSGALISAEYAMEQNRDVLAVPGPINIKQSAGTNKLISDGAIPVINVDVLKEWIGAQKAPLLHQTNQITDIELEERLAIIYNKMNYEPKHVDQLAFSCQISTAEILGKLLELELSGLIRQLPGKMFIRC